MYIAFRCYECGHQLYLDKNYVSFDMLEWISEQSCPSCGEEGHENWILVGARAEFPCDKDENEELEDEQ